MITYFWPRCLHHISHLELEHDRPAFCAAGIYKLTTRVSALTVTLVLVIRKAISLVISMGCTISGFASLASANACSVLELDV